MRDIVFYFDYVSPYSYLAWRALRRRAIPVEPRPIVFAALLEAAGQRGPAEIPAKRRFLIRDCLRRAEELGVGFAFPPVHPFRSLDALRASIGGAPELVDRLFSACWEQGRDLSDRSVLEEVLGAPLRDDPSLKDALRKLTDDAIARGVFGVPSFEVAGEIVWGSDRLDDAIALASDRLQVDEARFAKMAATPAGVIRRAVQPVDPAIAQHIDHLFASASFMTWLGVKVASIAPGTVTTTLEVRPEHRQQDGYVHAGVLTTIADHTAGAAAATGGKRVLTIELKINLLRPAKGSVLRCRSTVLKGGRTITVVESEVFDDATLVAKATITLAMA